MPVRRNISLKESSVGLIDGEGLESSRTLVLVMSQAAFDSDWVTLERHTAFFRDPTNQQRRFIPLRLCDCEIREMLDNSLMMVRGRTPGKPH